MAGCENYDLSDFVDGHSFLSRLTSWALLERVRLFDGQVGEVLDDPGFWGSR